MDIEEIEFKRGLTWRTITAIFVASLLFLPLSIYLNLVAGSTLAAAAVYVIVILFSELTRTFGEELSRQELFILYSITGYAAGFIPPFYWLIYRSFFIKQPIVSVFQIEGKPLLELIPWWLAPPLSSPAHSLRTLFHFDWIAPIILFASMSMISFFSDLMLALSLSVIYIELEPLPFPYAQIDSSLIITLSERKPEQTRYFIFSLAAGAIAASFTYLPYLLGTPLIPLPWVDFTWITQNFLPGAIIGLVTSPESYVMGFMLPLTVTYSLMLGSIAVWIVGNYVFLRIFPEAFPEWVSEYLPGMNISSLYQRSSIRIWYPFQFGAMLGFSLVLLVYVGSKVRSTLKTLFKAEKRAYRSFPPLKVTLTIFTLLSLSSVIIFHLLVPDYPIIIALSLSLGYSFATSILVVRSVGEMGIYPQMPWPWQIATYFSGYKGFAGWVINPYISVGGVSGLVSSTKVAYLTSTEPLDYYKALTIAFILDIVLGLFFLDFFWRIAPIPSAVYPYTLIIWPTYAMFDVLFSTHAIRIDPNVISYSFILSAFLGFIQILAFRRPIPFSPLAFLTGFTTLPTSSIPLFLGSLIGAFLFERALGKEKWHKIRGIVVAGFIAGSSIVVGIGIASTLLAKSSWIWPW